ncbi:T9SS type A sorting domain-containing protein [Algibacter aquimarinus]|uniref:Secretion system C-terminal sorting domain-containing protein n=1 Tax=Algibacter aquimarinus TaxID=1136748 RepID=A0ABP9HEG5_9FLAO
MKKITIQTLYLLVFSLLCIQISAQTATCDGTLPFEEQNGILIIEMESGIRNNSSWKTGSEADPNLSGSTINYIYWDGPQSFNTLTGASITYNIRINNPGTYRFAWRGRIGTGTERGEHNDAWLRIIADDWYMTQNNDPNGSAIEPIPDCNSNPNRGCPDDAKVNNWIKAFMNVDPTGDIDKRWKFVTNSRSNLVSQRFIWATFNTAGNYSIIVDARSSFFFMDKMVLRRTDVSDSTAFNLMNSESLCFDASLSLEEITNINEIKVYPNPTNDNITISNLPEQGQLLLKNIHGVTVRKIDYTTSNKTFDISNLQSGVYFLSNSNSNNYFVKKIIKL